MVTVALNYENVAKHPERIRRIRPFIDQRKWKKKEFSYELKRLEKVWNKKQNNCLQSSVFIKQWGMNRKK